ncbi:MAG TPA: MFS transporter [Myxococcota bacterium]|nr:MFS transporter [Myxococcota bacterium]
MRLLLGLSVYAAYVQALGAITAPFFAADLGLDDAKITAIMGFASLGAFGTAALARLADRHGRRGLVLASFAFLPLFSLASAIAPGVVSFTLAQVVVNALMGALFTGIVVAMVEGSSEQWRARGQAWFGLACALGGGVAVGMGAVIERVPFGWRGFWALAALPALAVPSVRRALGETTRFELARDAGRTSTTRAADLFRGPWRRRSLALLVVAALRPIALIATSSWPYYHMVKTLALSPATASLVFIAGGTVGQLGNPLGARLANGWGRKPAAVWGSLVCVASGIAFFWVPAGAGAVPLLIALSALNQAASAVFYLVDRLIATELFPTPLRATFSGVAGLMVAGAYFVANFGLSLLVGPLGGLVQAITWLSIVSFVPATVIFLAAVPETRGLSLEESAHEAPVEDESPLTAE